MKTLDRIDELCRERGISKRQLETGAGISRGSTSKWREKEQSQASLMKLAEYFEVSIDYLTGRSEYRSSLDESMLRGWDDRFGADALNLEVAMIERGLRVPVMEVAGQVAEECREWVYVAVEGQVAVSMCSDAVIVDRAAHIAPGDVVAVAADGQPFRIGRLVGRSLVPLDQAEVVSVVEDADHVLGRVVEIRRRF